MPLLPLVVLSLLVVALLVVLLAMERRLPVGKVVLSAEMLLVTQRADPSASVVLLLLAEVLLLRYRLRQCLWAKS